MKFYVIKDDAVFTCAEGMSYVEAYELCDKTGWPAIVFTDLDVASRHFAMRQRAAACIEDSADL